MTIIINEESRKLIDEFISRRGFWVAVVYNSKNVDFYNHDIPVLLLSVDIINDIEQLKSVLWAVEHNLDEYYSTLTEEDILVGHIEDYWASKKDNDIN